MHTNQQVSLFDDNVSRFIEETSGDVVLTDFAEIEELHRGYIQHKLRQIVDIQTSAKNKGEILEWIMIKLNPKDKVLPWTFQACCNCLGTDPYEFRLEITNILCREGVFEQIEKQVSRVRSKNRKKKELPKLDVSPTSLQLDLGS